MLGPDALLCTDTSRAYRVIARHAGIRHEPVNLAAGERVRQRVFHIQNVNAYDSRLKQWMRRFNGVATRYLDSYLGWRRMLERLHDNLNPQAILLNAGNPHRMQTERLQRSRPLTGVRGKTPCLSIMPPPAPPNRAARASRRAGWRNATAAAFPNPRSCTARRSPGSRIACPVAGERPKPERLDVVATVTLLRLGQPLDQPAARRACLRSRPAQLRITRARAARGSSAEPPSRGRGFRRAG